MADAGTAGAGRVGGPAGDPAAGPARASAAGTVAASDPGPRAALALPALAEEQLSACVHCGFCLPACPTYRELGEEPDSPRGRIWQVGAAARGELSPGSPDLLAHLDLCLDCRACETACPSGVGFGVILESARASLFRPDPLWELLMRRLWTHPAWFGRLASTLALSQRLGLDRLACRLPGAPAVLRAMVPALPRLSGRTSRRSLPRWIAARGGGAAGTRGPAGTPGPFSAPAGGRGPVEASGPAGTRKAAETPGPVGSPGPSGTPGPAGTREAAGPSGGSLGRAAVLLGCVADALFPADNEAMVRVLAAGGLNVDVPPEQGCCGSLHYHQGDLETARALARRNVAAFAGTGGPIVVNAAGCGAVMKHYDRLLPGDAAAAAFAARVRDFSEAAADLDLPAPRPLGPARVAWHDPCHLAHGQGVRRPPRELLRAIPGLQVVEMEDADACCGSAGLYNVLQWEMASAVLSRKMESVAAVRADWVVTGNPGCILQLRCGVLRAGSAVRVRSLCEVLGEAYAGGGADDGSL